MKKDTDILNPRSVEMVATPPEPHWVGDGFYVHNYIPRTWRLERERMDPFVLLDYGAKRFVAPSEEPGGVSAHPHRGFETVTIAYHGKVEHHDSEGNHGIIGEGEVQWMTAAGGVLHKEYHEHEWAKVGGDFQMVQLWVNLPARDKFSSPNYQSITREKIPHHLLPNDGTVEVIAGNYKGTTGAASTFSPIHLYNVHLNEVGCVTLSFPSHYNTALLVIKGAVEVNGGSPAKEDELVLMANDGEEFMVQAYAESTILVMSGEPLREPIVARGPFVVNTTDELIAALRDYHSGKMGELK